MGQRTAIILQHVNNYEAKYGKRSAKETRVFYHQWGIGRILPSQLISILNGTLSTSSYSSSFAMCIKPQGCLDITKEYDDLKGVLDSVSFDKPELVGEILKNASNNNGGLFVRVTTNEEGELESIEYAYMLGHEEDGDYKHFCTEDEWMKKNGEKYITEDFKTIYDKTIAYFGAKQRLDAVTKAEDKEAA